MSNAVTSSKDTSAAPREALKDLRSRVVGSGRSIPRSKNIAWWDGVVLALELDPTDLQLHTVLRRALLKHSLDAALNILEVRVPGCSWAIEREREADGSFTYWCDLILPDAAEAATVCHSSISPALAVMASMLDVLMRQPDNAGVQTRAA